MCVFFYIHTSFPVTFGAHTFHSFHSADMPTIHSDHDCTADQYIWIYDEKDRQCTYKVTLRRVYETIIVVEKQ